ncbi:leucine-rich repeat domain-containing protein [Bacteroides sp. OttesenSCG-928-N06]|nr:leucine-rich repeat domain-containing protein [Bacteroides sp. OttesenSCG-928-N06]
MKKVLFYASVLTLAFASCTDREFDSPIQEKNHGIIFESATAEDDATRGHYELLPSKAYASIWHAEEDRILVYTKGAMLGSNSVAIADWDLTLNQGSAKYKATKSERLAQFTGVNDDNTLHFDGKESAYFLAVYPAGNASGMTMPSTGIRTFSFPIGDLNVQVQTDVFGTGIGNHIFKYDFIKANAENTWDAVGEKANLRFKRQATAAVFKTKGLDKYAKLFGKLLSIEMNTENAFMLVGGVPTVPTVPSNLTYGGGAEATIAINETTMQSSVNITALGAPSNKVKVLFDATTSGLDWKDEYTAFAAIRHVNRTTISEDIRVKHTFENITFEEIPSRQNHHNWPTDLLNADGTPGPAEGFVGTFVLDITKYPYLVTNETSIGANDRSLIILGGKNSDGSDFEFEQIFETGGKVIWPIGTTTYVDLGEFKSITSEIEVDMDKVGEFVNVENLELNVNATIPTKSLENLTALKNINMPEVTFIAGDAFSSNVELNTVILPKYSFSDMAAVNPKILKKDHLMVLDMSAVSFLGQGFPGTGFSLAGFANLEEVTVKDGLILTSNSFNGCENLETINGGPVVLMGANAFSGCEALESVVIRDDVDNPGLIPSGSFSGCILLESVKDENGDDIEPTVVEANAFKDCGKLTGIVLDNATSIGNSAFEGCVELGSQNLRGVTTLGEKAFNGCSKLVGTTPYKDSYGNEKEVLWISATTIPAQAFNNCGSLVYVYFENATTVEGGILGYNGTPAERKLQEVKFGAKFDSPAAQHLTLGSHATTINVTLFVVTGQDNADIDTNEITFGGTSTPTPMASVIKENWKPNN